MKTMNLIAALVSASLMAGCAATSGAAYEPIVDMRGVNGDRYRGDLRECQQYAQQHAGAGTGAVVGAVAGALLMAALMPSGSRNWGAREGAIMGGVGGAVQAGESQAQITMRCLAGRGYIVLG